jgi:hypothetical protein
MANLRRREIRNGPERSVEVLRTAVSHQSGNRLYIRVRRAKQGERAPHTESCVVRPYREAECLREVAHQGRPAAPDNGGQVIETERRAAVAFQLLGSSPMCGPVVMRDRRATARIVPRQIGDETRRDSPARP